MKDLSSEKPYHFADFVRFVAMCAIIFQHSFIVDKAILSTDYSSVLVFFSLKVMAKIGSISFFMISGFLLSSALDRYSPKDYLQKRVKNIFKPYILFFGAYLFLDSIGAFFGAERVESVAHFPGFVATKILGILFFTSYWFIFNYFISVMLLLSLRKYLYEQWLGILLFCCTMIYTLNVHVEWFLPHHTTAFVGFTFFLWLGANLKKIERSFTSFIESTPYWKMWAVVAITLAINLYETFYLIDKGALVVDSSLKFTNILYALSIFLLLCKIGLRAQFSFLNPRDETYPLYLIHPIFLKVIIYGLFPLVPALRALVTIDQVSEVGWLTILLYQLGWFMAVYMISLMAVRLLLQSSFCWVFGKQRKERVSPVQSIWLLFNIVKNFKRS